jgi:hypothetical protein
VRFGTPTGGAEAAHTPPRGWLCGKAQRTRPGAVMLIV